MHLNGNIGMAFHEIGEEELASLTDLERDRLGRIGRFMTEELGYVSIQGTRPGLIGAALTDSPVGQLAWILDKLKAWTFPADALPHEILGWDRMLTDVMIYWLTGTAGSSAYMAYASESAWDAPKPRPESRRPSSCSRTTSASAATPRPSTGSHGGRTSRAAAGTSRRWRSPRRSWRTCGSSSPPSAEPPPSVECMIRLRHARRFAAESCTRPRRSRAGAGRLGG
ncbi:hypothetical protein NKG05_13785 [Oerskovia sp. M15]